MSRVRVLARQQGLLAKVAHPLRGPPSPPPAGSPPPPLSAPQAVGRARSTSSLLSLSSHVVCWRRLHLLTLRVTLSIDSASYSFLLAPPVSTAIPSSSFISRSPPHPPHTPTGFATTCVRPDRHYLRQVGPSFVGRRCCTRTHGAERPSTRSLEDSAPRGLRGLSTHAVRATVPNNDTRGTMAAALAHARPSVGSRSRPACS